MIDCKDTGQANMDEKTPNVDHTRLDKIETVGEGHSSIVVGTQFRGHQHTGKIGTGASKELQYTLNLVIGSDFDGNMGRSAGNNGFRTGQWRANILVIWIHL